jgi:hypothetical protein
MHSVDEISTPKESKIVSISNYRGYETMKAIEQYQKGNLGQLVFGQGFGTLVDIEGYYVMENTTLIPIFHNGYAYILLKTGILGLLCFAFVYINIFSYCRKILRSVKQITRNSASFFPLFVIAGLSSLYVINIVVSAIFNSVYILPMITTGFFLQYMKNNTNNFQ